MPKNGQKWLKKSQNWIFWHFDYIMILPSFFQCFSAVNENLAGKKSNDQEKKLPPDPEICKFLISFFFSGEFFFSNNDPILFKFSGVVK